jgi:hypothetical protein
MGKRGPKIDLAVAARILVDAAMLGDEAAAKRHNVSTKTVSRYRALAATDDNLSKVVGQASKLASREWASDLGAAIKGQIGFLKRAAQEADPKSPAAVHAVADALEILADVALTSEMLDARLAEQADSDREEDRPAASADDAEGAIH